MIDSAEKVCFGKIENIYRPQITYNQFRSEKKDVKLLVEYADRLENCAVF